MTSARVVIVGGGAAGLAAACELVQRGVAVDVVSIVAPRRSVVASSGDAMAAARTSDDELAAHEADAAFQGASAAEAAAIRALVAAGPGLLARIAALGVPFAQDEAGVPIRRPGSGHRRDRLATVGTSTKREIVEALDRRLALAARAHPDLVRRLEGWEVVAITVHEGVCVGVVAQDLRTMVIHAISARAVLLASGGFAGAWAASAAAPGATGGATAAALRAGASLADPDAVDLAPLAIVGRAKRHAISDFVRAAGARVWVPLDREERRRGRDVPSRERRDLLRHLDEEAGHLVDPDTSARAISRALFIEGDGVFDAGRGQLEACAYVDLGHLGGAIAPEARAEIDRLTRITGVDMGAAPAVAAPAVHDTLGGIAVRFAIDGGGGLVDNSAENHATSVPGLYAAGSAAKAYHGTARLPGHRLLGSLVGGELAARAIVAYCGDVSIAESAHAALEAAEADARSSYEAIVARKGEPGVRAVREALGEALDAISGLSISGLAEGAPQLADLTRTIDDLTSRAAACGADDDADAANRGAPDLRRLEATALLARAVASAARARAQVAASGRAAARVVVRLEHDVLTTTVDARDATPTTTTTPPSAPTRAGDEPHAEAEVAS